MISGEKAELLRLKVLTHLIICTGIKRQFCKYCSSSISLSPGLVGLLSYCLPATKSIPWRTFCLFAWLLSLYKRLTKACKSLLFRHPFLYHTFLQLDSWLTSFRAVLILACSPLLHGRYWSLQLFILQPSFSVITAAVVQISWSQQLLSIMLHLHFLVDLFSVCCFLFVCFICLFFT